MKCIKNILSLILTLALVLSVAAIPAFATEKTQGTLVGDCTLYLPDTDSIKVTYNLVDQNGEDVAEDVTYSVTSDDEGWEKWLDVNAKTGEVYVSHKAVGKSFSVTAESETYKASQLVSISNTVLCTDFESGQPDWIYNDSVVESIEKNGTNSYLYIPGGGTWAMTYSTVRLAEKNIPVNTQHLSIDVKFMVSPKKSGDGTHPWRPMAINFANDKGMSKKTSGQNTTWRLETLTSDLSNTNTRTLTTPEPHGKNANGIATYSAKKALSSEFTVNPEWYDETTGKFKGSFEFAELELDIVDDDISTRINGGTINTYTYYEGLLDFDYATVNNIEFSGAIDDLKIYTGEKVSHSFKTGLKIDGETNILRAPVGISANISYKLAIENAALAGSELPTNVLWTVSNHNGVTVADASKGEIKVDGDATSGEFSVIALDADGNVLAKKDVNIIDKITTYSCTNNARFYCDMESEKYYGGALGDYNSRGYAGYYVEGSGLGSVGKTEVVDGKTNRYISSKGDAAWSSNGSGARMRVYDNQFGYGMTNSLLTFEGRFKIENDVITSDEKNPEAKWSLIFAAVDPNNNPSKAALDLRYDDLGEGVAGIYIYENGTGYNGEIKTNEEGTSKWTVCEGRLIALVGIDTWFDLRVETDYTNKVYNIWIDDVLVAKNIAVGDSEHFRDNSYIYSGAAFDDIARYTGSKATDTIAATEQFTVFKDFSAQEEGSMGFVWAEATPDEQSSSASAALMSATDYSSATLIAAIYGADNTLIDVSLEPVSKTSAGNSIAFVKAVGKVPANGYAKIFLWNMNTLVPVK